MSAGMVSDAEAPSVGGQTPMTTARDTVEIEKLRERLRVSDEWNARLQHQLQELLRLPRSDVEAMRERMQHPDIAIPLLQCYDAAIQEKAEDNEQLVKEITRLRSQLEIHTSERNDLGQAVRVAEDLAKHVRAQSSEETHRLQSRMKEVEEECNRLRQELSRALSSEGAVKLELEKATKRIKTLGGEADAQRAEASRKEEALRHAQHTLRQREAVEGEVQANSEVQRVQLSLLSKEKEEKLQELERLRTKMVQALRQSDDNHTAHLRVVEERHRIALEDMRALQRTQELEVQKLRAQLARVDSGSRGVPSTPLRTTTEILETQARQSLELELKRVYAELSSVQVQRDDAVLRYEQLAVTVKRSSEQKAQDALRETEQLRRRGDDATAKLQRSEQEAASMREELRRQRDTVRRIQQDLQTASLEKEEMLRQQRDAQGRESQLNEALERCREECNRAVAVERQRADALEQRVNDTLAEVRSAKERAHSETKVAQQERDELSQHVRDAQEGEQRLREKLMHAERGHADCRNELHHVQEALQLHKQRLIACDERIQQLQGQLEGTQQQMKAAILEAERFRLENGRLSRAQDRLMERAF